MSSSLSDEDTLGTSISSWAVPAARSQFGDTPGGDGGGAASRSESTRLSSGSRTRCPHVIEYDNPTSAADASSPCVESWVALDPSTFLEIVAFEGATGGVTTGTLSSG